MKKRLLITAFLACCLTSLLAQSCLPEGITFTSQTQIDSFQINYPGCTEIEGDVIVEGSNISNLEGLNSLTALGKDFSIGTVFGDGNPLLTSLSGLDNITSIGESFVICHNNSLTDFSGLDNLNSIQSNLSVFDNPALTSFAGFDNVTYIGDLQISGQNLSLTSLSGLGNLTSIGQNLSISQVPLLINLSGLDNLVSIGFSIIISGCDALTSLNGLEQLTYARAIQLGNQYLGGNDVLTSIEALKNIEPGNIYLIHIHYNPSLSTCDVSSICDVLANPPSNIDVEIYDNAPGCNSQQEVETACDTLTVPENNFKSEFSMYPNPATKEIFISTNNDITIKEINIYNQVGQIIIHKGFLPNKIDVSMLQEGMYVIELVTSDMKVKEKLIIM